MRFGMDYGGTNVKAGVFTDDGEALVIEHVPLQSLKDGTLLNNLVALAQRVANGHAITAGGIAIKGLVDTVAGCVVDDVGDGALLAGIDLRRKFGDALGVPFAVENDARAYAWGEWLFGAGRGSTVMACLTLGTGVGGALVAHGAPFVGADALGGILGGHLSIDRNGPECPCGHRGCLELYCSAPALAARVQAAHPTLTDARSDTLPHSNTLPAFFEAVRQHGAPFQGTLDAYLDDLALGVVNVVHAYGTDRVVLGGGVLHSADVILPGLTERVHDRAWTVPRRRVGLVAATRTDHAAALGAAFHPALD